MLSNHIGEDNFLNGVSIYLKRHEYENTVTADLWEAIEEATGVDVASMMTNWVTKVIVFVDLSISRWSTSEHIVYFFRWVIRFSRSQRPIPVSS